MKRLIPVLVSVLGFQLSTFAFEGRIAATVTQGGQTSGLLYTVGTNQLRIERTDTNWPHARNIVDRQTGALTLLFPHNRSFVRLKPASENSAAPPPGMPAMPVPAGIGPQAGPPPGAARMPARPEMPAPPGGLPPGIGPQAQPAGAPAMPAMPMMPMMPGEKVELKATGQKTNLLGYVCEKYELKQRGEVMEIWVTDKLFPFQPYQQNQPHPAGPRMIEEQWPGLLQERKLFPLRASLRFDHGAERFRFEVQSIQAEKITDADGKLFQPPPDYHEIEPLPF